MRYNGLLLLMVILMVGLAACSNKADPPQVDEEGKEVSSAMDEEQMEQVNVELFDADGVIVGSAIVTEAEEGVDIALEATHLPEGTHGFHIHENGICEGPDFESAGGHFNPEDTSHGFDHEEGPHAGDLPNLEVEDDGTVEVEVTNEMVTLDENASNSLLKEGGTSLIIHADADDGTSQPSGDAGDRIVCGVIAK